MARTPGSMMASVLLAVAAGIFFAASGATALGPADAPPPPSSACTVCLTFNLTIPPIPPSADLRPYFLFYNANDTNAPLSPEDHALCLANYEPFAYSVLTNAYDQLAADGNVTVAPVVFNTTLCSPKVLQWCGQVPSQADAEVLKNFVLLYTNYIVEIYFQYYLCPFMPPGYAWTTTYDGCSIKDHKRVICQAIPEPFPGCRCNKTQGITPLMVDPDLTQLPGRTNKTNLYCFGIKNTNQPVQSSCSSSLLNKVEIWADWSKRSSVKGIRVQPHGGPARWLPMSWGPRNSNTLKASSLNWSMDQAVGGEVCIEVNKDIELYELCMNTSCFLSLFNEKRDCCPAYASSPSNFLLPPP